VGRNNRESGVSEPFFEDDSRQKNRNLLSAQASNLGGTLRRLASDAGLLADTDFT